MITAKINKVFKFVKKKWNEKIKILMGKDK